MYNLLSIRDSELATITDDAQKKVNKWTKLQLDGDKLHNLANTSKVVGEFFDYLEYTKKDKTLLESLPFVGKALKNNRYSKLTIDKAVELFTTNIKDINSLVSSTLEWLRVSRNEAKKDLASVNMELEKISQTVIENKENATSRLKTLQYRRSNQLNLTPEEEHELEVLEENLAILDGKRVALETYRNALDAKCRLFTSNIDAAIKIQGKAESAKALPDVLRVSLENIRTSGALRSSLGGLKDSEVVVKMLMGEAVSSSNILTEEAQAIEAGVINFKEHLEGLKTLKTSVDTVLGNFS